ncbi:MAG: hypothetical protein HPY55_12480 [Firmicutes bacterium]|nr:hypothetical protein [Bacillota bacterium]
MQGHRLHGCFDGFRGTRCFHWIGYRPNAGRWRYVVVRIEGFGADSRIHSARLLDLSTDLPLLVEIVDRRERAANSA